MKEHPILFSGPMVRAILEGRKTMTRRVVKYPMHSGKARRFAPIPGAPANAWWNGRLTCPYGQPGDRLWVRETFFEEADPNTSCFYDHPRYCYRASLSSDDASRCFVDDGDGCAVENKDGTIKSPWRPSIHMPRRASRILLEITAVRVERVQDISEGDAKAEGAEAKSWDCLKQAPTSLFMRFGGIVARDPLYTYGFYDLWDSINAKRGYGWDSNPWVWVVEFKRIMP